MNTVLKELLAITKQQPAAVARSYSSTSINSNTTTDVVAASTGQAIKILGLWISGRNDHATAVLTVKIQDNTGTPIVFAEVFIGPASQVNGFVNLAEIPLYSGVGKKVSAVTAAGTANTVRVNVVYTYE